MTFTPRLSSHAMNISSGLPYRSVSHMSWVVDTAKLPQANCTRDRTHTLANDPTCPRVSEEIWAALNIEVLRANEDKVSTRKQGLRKREIPQKTLRPAPSSGTIPTCENPGVGIELCSPWWEASSLTTTPLVADSVISTSKKIGSHAPAATFTALLFAVTPATPLYEVWPLYNENRPPRVKVHDFLACQILPNPDDYDGAVNDNDGMRHLRGLVESVCVEHILARRSHEINELQNKQLLALNTDDDCATPTKRNKLDTEHETGGEDDHEDSINDNDYENSVDEVSDQKYDDSLDVLTHFTNEFPSISCVKKEKANWSCQELVLRSVDLTRNQSWVELILGDPGSIPGRVTPNFRTWESCRTMLLVGVFSRRSSVSPTLSFRRRSILTSITLIGSQDLDRSRERRMAACCGDDHRQSRRDGYRSVAWPRVGGDAPLSTRPAAGAPSPPPPNQNQLCATPIGHALPAKRRSASVASTQLPPSSSSTHKHRSVATYGLAITRDRKISHTSCCSCANDRESQLWRKQFTVEDKRPFRALLLHCPGHRFAFSVLGLLRSPTHVGHQMGDTRQNPPNSSFVRHDSYTCHNPGATPPVIELGSP
ncbi:hypothetical protein PR048_029229 [Dryococelus australis]|uniref:Uncharacterized protein n=1 Tax=Dryococelus australis TaxID=614101 RepID=A0ABQ9GD63_9NEOP|nr:hypothetical protein PR048_029229 [Dryococelus australis]